MMHRVYMYKAWLNGERLSLHNVPREMKRIQSVSIHVSVHLSFFWSVHPSVC